MSKKDTVRQGERSEQIFATRCFVEHGYMVSRPDGTTDYDLIIDCDGDLKKVQVKSTEKVDGNVNICKGSNGQEGSKKYPYPYDSVDFFAVHLATIDEWYIIPRSATGDSMNLRIARKRQGKYTGYKDNWKFSRENA